VVHSLIPGETVGAEFIVHIADLSALLLIHEFPECTSNASALTQCLLHVCRLTIGETLMKNVLVLDFDGLICDGLKECVLVTWNGHYKKDVLLFSDQGLEAIPNTFVERFQECRNFSKHLGHFLVPLVDQTTSFPTQDAFNRVYNSINPVLVNEFVEKVNAYRQLVRTEKKAYWLACHTFYDGFETFLRVLSFPAYIVTAKDSDSVHEILCDKSIPFVQKRIFGEQRSKLAALTTIAQMEQIPNSQLYFIDDNINNVLEARSAGYHAYWATWGYNSPDHFHFAAAHSIPGISLADFLTNRFNFPFFANQPKSVSSDADAISL